MAFPDTPKIFFVTFAFLFIGGLFLLIGFATPNWLEADSTSLGLWQFCGTTLYGFNQCGSLGLLVNGRFIAMRALSCIALILAAGSGVFALAFIPTKANRKTLAYLVAAGCVASASCHGVTLYLFGISYISVGISYRNALTVYTFGYSFILSAIATASLVLASILAFVMACNIRPENALPTAGVVLYNHQGMHGNPQNAGTQPPQAQYTGQYGQQYPAQNPAQHPGVNKY